MPLHRKPIFSFALAITAIAAIVVPVVPAQAGSIPVTYSLAGIGTVVGSTSTTLTLEGTATGSVLSGNPALNSAWNPVSYSDQSVLDLTTGLLRGNFTLSFADGGTLFGTLFEDDSAIDASPTQTGAFPQTLTLTGGTGEFTGATGSFSGNGFLGTAGFTVSGSGSVNAPAIPEPGSAALLVGGLALLIGRRRYARRKSADESLDSCGVHRTLRLNPEGSAE